MLYINIKKKITIYFIKVVKKNIINIYNIKKLNKIKNKIDFFIKNLKQTIKINFFYRLKF